MSVEDVAVGIDPGAHHLRVSERQRGLDLPVAERLERAADDLDVLLGHGRRSIAGGSARDRVELVGVRSVPAGFGPVE